MILPNFALTIPRPWTWMIGSGIRRDWVVRVDPSHLVGGLVALHSAAAGDADGWRRFDAWTDGRVDRKQVADLCPHNAIIGLAVVDAAVRHGPLWRLHFGRAVVIDPIGPLLEDDNELWPIPRRRREQIKRVFLAGPHPAGASVSAAHS